jgi:universal stress protein A
MMKSDQASVERKCEDLVIRGGIMKTFHRILVATDFSPASKPALKEAIALAKGNGTKLLITHAYSLPSLTEAQPAAGVYEQLNRNLKTEAQKKLQALVEEARKEGVEAEALVLSGVPFEAITEAAREKKADLVIMGTHGRTGVPRFFVGSVASRVISTAPCPVMTVRAA